MCIVQERIMVSAGQMIQSSNNVEGLVLSVSVCQEHLFSGSAVQVIKCNISLTYNYNYKLAQLPE